MNTYSVKELADRIINGYRVNRDDIDRIKNSDINELSEHADRIRKELCGNGFSLCTIINGKSGRCSENCKFCSQSSFSACDIEVYDFIDDSIILESAKKNRDSGVGRFSIVTSGRKLSGLDLKKEIEAYKKISDKTDIGLCASNGLLGYDEMILLKKAGVTRYHNNLETSRKYFEKICTTHTYDEKIKTIKATQDAGMSVCSGGIIGMGENLDDRIDMAFELKNLDVDSVPVNVLNPIQGTPLENVTSLEYDEIIRTISIFRFILPDKVIRLAGGRICMNDRGKRTLKAGINGFITGDMLTTAGAGIKDDISMVSENGFEVIEFE